MSNPLSPIDRDQAIAVRRQVAELERQAADFAAAAHTLSLVVIEMVDRPAPKRDLLTVPETMSRLNVSRSTIYALLESGELTGRKIGRRRMIHPESVRAFAEAS